MPRASDGREQHTAGGARGLEVSPRGFLEDQLVQRQVRHSSTETGVLTFKVPQTTRLVQLQAAVLPTPPVIGLFSDL